MSLGTGVVLVALILVAAWQVDKRGAWRKVGLLSLALVGLAVVAAAVLLGNSKQKERDAAHARQAEVEAKSNLARVQIEEIRAGNMTSLAGLQLGNNLAEAKYLWGRPREIKQDMAFWDDFVTQKQIAFTPSGTARAIFCSSARDDGCGAPAGLRIGSSESELLRVLRLPTQVEFRDTLKLATYGQGGTSKLRVALAKGKIKSFLLIAVTKEGFTKPTVDDVNALSKRFDTDFSVGLAEQRAGRLKAACARFEAAALLAHKRVVLAAELGNAAHIKEAEGTERLVHRYLSDECGVR